MTYTQTIRVRYGEVDAQGVVFNAHYLAYLDDVSDTWLRTFDGNFEETGWEIMLRRADLTWHGPAGVHDDLVVTAEVVRWGTTSFDMAFEVRVDDRLVLTATAPAKSHPSWMLAVRTMRPALKRPTVQGI